MASPEAEANRDRLDKMESFINEMKGIPHTVDHFVWDPQSGVYRRRRDSDGGIDRQWRYYVLEDGVHYATIIWSPNGVFQGIHFPDTELA